MSQDTEYSETESIPTVSEEGTSSGEIRINHEVIANIVRLATLEVPGVVAVGGGFKDGIAEMFKDSGGKGGVKVSLDEVDEYAIEIKVQLKFGVELAKTGKIVQQTIIEYVERMTSQTVAKVDVIIESVRMEPKETPEAESPVVQSVE
ncbi:MAG: Asp23/Gls24 family envelope stress response protein [Verrucomicrobiota bacterium]